MIWPKLVIISKLVTIAIYTGVNVWLLSVIRFSEVGFPGIFRVILIEDGITPLVLPLMVFLNAWLIIYTLNTIKTNR